MSNTGWQKFHVLMTQRRYAQAEEAARTMIAADPADDLGYGLLARALGEQRKYVTAKGAIEEAIRLAPDTDAHLFSLANIHLSVGEFKDALRVIDQAIEMNPSNADHHQLRAIALVKLRRNDEALAAAGAGLVSDPQHLRIQVVRALALQATGEVSEAKSILYQQLAETPNDSLTHCQLGFAHLATADSTEAAKHFRESLRLDPESADARRGLVEALKARRFFYAQLLRFAYWVARFPKWLALAVILVVIAVPAVVGAMAPSGSAIRTLADAGLALLVVISQMILVARALSTLLLRIDPENRMVLSDRQVSVSNSQLLLLTVMFLVLISYPWTGLAFMMLGCISLAQAIMSIEYIYLPARPQHRPPLVTLYLLALAASILGVAATLPSVSTQLATLLGSAFVVSTADAHSYVEYSSFTLLIVSWFVLFRMLRKSAKRLALRDRLAGHFHEDE